MNLSKGKLILFNIMKLKLLYLPIDLKSLENESLKNRRIKK